MRLWHRTKRTRAYRFVILDADIGSSTDDLFALEMLYRYDEQRLCQLLGVVVDREDEANADFTDVMNTYFGHPYVPIGLVQDGVKNPKVWIDYAKVAYMTEADGTTPMFQRTIDQHESIPDGYKLYRRLHHVCSNFLRFMAEGCGHGLFAYGGGTDRGIHPRAGHR